VVVLIFQPAGQPVHPRGRATETRTCGKFRPLASPPVTVPQSILDIHMAHHVEHPGSHRQDAPDRGHLGSLLWPEQLVVWDCSDQWCLLCFLYVHLVLAVTFLYYIRE
jgi:hypothetical protein